MPGLDPFALYRQPKVKMILNKLIILAVVITILYCVASLFLNHGVTNIWSFLNSGDFYTLIIVVVLGWVGYSLLNGKFNPPEEMQQAVAQRKRQKAIQRGQYQPQQSVMYQEPLKRRTPIKIQTGTCAFCGKEISEADLREFEDYEGNIIYVCDRCFNRG